MSNVPKLHCARPKQTCGTSSRGLPGSPVWWGALFASRLGSAGRTAGSKCDSHSMGYVGSAGAREASGKSAASFPPALALLESGKGSGSGKGCPVALIMLRRFGFGGSTNPRGWPHEGDPRGAGSAFRQRSSLSLWDANSPHASLAPSSAFVPTIPAAWRIAGPSCRSSARSSIPRRPLMDTAVAWTPFAERAARCFSSFQRTRPRGDAPTVACGQAPQAAARRRDPRRRLDLIPRNQRAADRRPRSQRALTLTAQRKVQCL